MTLDILSSPSGFFRVSFWLFTYYDLRYTVPCDLDVYTTLSVVVYRIRYSSKLDSMRPLSRGVQTECQLWASVERARTSTNWSFNKTALTRRIRTRCHPGYAALSARWSYRTPHENLKITTARSTRSSPQASAAASFPRKRAKWARISSDRLVEVTFNRAWRDRCSKRRRRRFPLRQAPGLGGDSCSSGSRLLSATKLHEERGACGGPGNRA